MCMYVCACVVVWTYLYMNACMCIIAWLCHLFRLLLVLWHIWFIELARCRFAVSLVDLVFMLDNVFVWLRGLLLSVGWCVLCCRFVVLLCVAFGCRVVLFVLYVVFVFGVLFVRDVCYIECIASADRCALLWFNTNMLRCLPITLSS